MELRENKIPVGVLYLADCVQLHTYNYPNWFHRLMQRLCFGFRWEKL